MWPRVCVCVVSPFVANYGPPNGVRVRECIGLCVCVVGLPRRGQKNNGADETLIEPLFFKKAYKQRRYKL